MAVTLCPVAIVAGCEKCPIFSVCPLKSVIGDQPSASERGSDAKSDAKPKKKSAQH